MLQPLGIYGGTFDPVHLGHMRAALEVLEFLQLERLCFIPNGSPPHRETPGCTAQQRVAMLRAAIAGQSGFEVDEREIRRNGASYTVDTLAELRDEHGEQPLCLIMGMDAFLGLPSWHRWQEVFDLAHLVVMRRPGWQPPTATPLGRLLEERRVEECTRMSEAPAGHILLQTVTPLDISATRIRALIAAGRSARYLVPDAVWQMIENQGYYGRSGG